MTKYIIFTDHKSGFNSNDRYIELEAKTLLDAIIEAGKISIHDDNLYCVCLYEKVGKDTYTQIMKSYNGISFFPAGNIFDIRKYSAYKNSWYDIVEKKSYINEVMR